MADKIADLDQARSLKQTEIDKVFWLFAEDLPLGFSKAHCAKAREMVGPWKLWRFGPGCQLKRSKS
ncbi:hypothetical protein [Pseudomonas yamanorum]|uniref:hypothetical protein n=1 Tax=Pseudomonas yamanorum TaxID=515393 RepID=UPI003BA39A69